MNTLRIAAAVIVFAVTPVAAHAADLHAQQPIPMAAASAVTNWDGPYIGAQVGLGSGTVTVPSTSATTGLTGLFAGGQAGYNFHLSDNIVAGVEGDLVWNNQQGSFPGTASTARINWDGSVRGRLGLDLGEIMPYAEVGVAFANATISGKSGDFNATHYRMDCGRRRGVHAGQQPLGQCRIPV
jgi:outer membrane immunogenic protein